MGYTLREGLLEELQRKLADAERRMHIPHDVRTAFERYDINRSGKLDYKELRNALKDIRGIDASMEHAQYTLEKYDRDRSGLMELEEARPYDIAH